MKKHVSVRLVDIAKMAGVSVGTVDRVIHNRGRVSKESEEKVKAILELVNYQPNLIARSLAFSKKEYTLVVLIPEYEKGDYWEALFRGIEAAIVKASQYKIGVSIKYFNQYNKKSFDLLAEQIIKEKYNGVLLATLFVDSVIHLSKKLDQKNIPYIYIDSNIEDQNQLSYFGVNSVRSGEIAARLLLDTLCNEGDILIAKAKKEDNIISLQMKNREFGFYKYLKVNEFKGDVHVMDLDLTDPLKNFNEFTTVLKEKNIKGITVFNSSCHVVCDYVKAKGLKDLVIVGYDLIPANLAYLDEGIITALLGQRPYQQGFFSIMALCNHLLFDKKTNKVNYMPIDIIIKQNAEFYKDDFIY